MGHGGTWWDMVGHGGTWLGDGGAWWDMVGRCLKRPKDGGLEALDEKRVGKHEYSWCCYVRSYNLNPGQ